MKRLALLCKTKPVGEMYRVELLTVFEGYLDVTVIYDEYNQKEADRLIAKEYDIILVTNVYSFNKSRHLIKNNPALIYLDFAFLKESIEQLKQFPVGTQTLISMNYCSTSHQAASILYDVGVRNLNLYVDYPQNENLIGKHFALALTNGQPNEKLGGVPQLFDLGERKIALSTILEVAMHADLMDEVTEKRIYEYRDGIAVPQNYLDYSFGHSLVHKFQFQDIANCLEYPLIILDEHNVIKNCNAAFNAMLFETRPTMRPLADTRLYDELKEVLLTHQSLDNRLVEVRGQNKGFLVSKEKLNKQDRHSSSYIVTIKDVSHLRNLEANLKRQMKKQGYTTKYNFADIKGESPQIKEAVAIAKRIAMLDKPTLITGESGTGKELFAQSIHANSSRSGFPFIGINCAALPDALLESELFGYEEGAFTGARKGGKAGLFELVNHGTLFLDEIGDMPLRTQAKLLRVLEEQEIMKVGGGTILSVDVRIIAATNHDLNKLAREGTFRHDLFYRLSHLMVIVPPLRERCGDIVLLFSHFLQKLNLPELTVELAVTTFLSAYSWEGNVRELRNCVEYMASMCDGHISLEHLPMYMKTLAIQPQRSVYLQPVPEGDGEEAPIVRTILTLLTTGSMGRNALLRALADSGGAITEYRLRALLQRLEADGFVCVSKGRNGCQLTGKGRTALQ